MLLAEDEEISVCEEPKIYYYSTNANYGVRAYFSERNKKHTKYEISFTPNTLENDFSLCNTIMKPSIKIEGVINSNKSLSCNNKNNVNDTNIKNNSINFLRKSYLQKDNTRAKTEISNEMKKSNDEWQIKELLTQMKENNNNNENLEEKTVNQKENLNFEKNPYFIGNKANFTNKNNNNKKIDIYSEDENDDDFFNRGPSRSVFRDDKKRCLINEDDEKSEKIIKKSSKLNIKKDFFDLNNKNQKEKEKDKVLKEKIRKKKIKFSIKKENEKKKEDSLKLKTNKMKSNNKNNDNNLENYYHSNKCIVNNYNINIYKSVLKKNKIDNNSIEEEEDFDKNMQEKKNQKKNIIKSQRFVNYFIKAKNLKYKDMKDDNKKINKNAITNKFKSFQQRKGLNYLKQYLKKKEEKDEIEEKEEKDIDNPKEKSFNKETKESELKIKNKSKRYNSKNELRKLVLNKRDSDKDSRKKQKLKQRIERVKSVDKLSLKIIKLNSKANNKDLEEESNKGKIKRFSTNEIKLKMKDKDNNFEGREINKCYTANLSKNKGFSMFSELPKNKSAMPPYKRKTQNIISGINLFGKGVKSKSHKIDFESALKKNLKKTQFNLFSKDKFTNTEFNDCDYLKYTLDCMELILDIDIEKQIRLKNKINFNFPKTKKNKKKKIALFDLDETLIHCTGDIRTQKEKYQHAIEIKLPGKQAVQVGINIRPFWKQTLNLIRKNYHIVIYTASHQAYADSVLDFMDPKKKYFKYRLYRNNCSLIDVEGAKFYVKDLDIFNEHYDLKDIVIIDNSVLSFAYHLHNGIPIVPYYDEDKEGSLYVVGLYLIHIFKEDDLREANKKQINLDSFLEEAKKNKEEYIDENQIVEESISKEEDNNNETKNEVEVDKRNISRRSGEEIKKSEKEKIAEKKSSRYLPINDHRNDFAQKKLISQSKLINMYYECKDKSSKKKDGNEEKQSEDKEIGEKSEKENIFCFNDEFDCKSDPGYFNTEEQNNQTENGISEEEKEEKFLKRLFTIVEDNPLNEYNKMKDSENNSNKGYKNNNKKKLGFIRSNFYNTFKI